MYDLRSGGLNITQMQSLAMHVCLGYGTGRAPFSKKGKEKNPSEARARRWMRSRIVAFPSGTKRIEGS